MYVEPSTVNLLRLESIIGNLNEVVREDIAKQYENCSIKKYPLLRTFAPKSSYGEIFFISRLELGHKVLTPKRKKKMGVTDFVSEKMAVEKCLKDGAY